MSQVVAFGLQLLWIVWLPAAVAVAVRELRVRLPEPGAARRVIVLLLLLGVAAAALSFVLPFRIDASGIMELASWERGGMVWKGTAGKSLLGLGGLVGIGGSPGPHDLVLVTRSFVALAPLLVGALVAGRYRGREALAAGGVLFVSPLFLHAMLGGFNFWFFPLLVLAALLAAEALERGPSVAGSLALASSVALVGFSRPETMACAVLLALWLYVRAARRRERLNALLLGAVLVLFAVTLTDLAGFLLDRVRTQPLLMGSDAAPAAPRGPLALVMLRRVVSHVPRDLGLLLVALHGLVLLAAARLWAIVRSRRATAAEWAAVLLLVVEFAAIALHREGFVKLTKYGQLVVVPIWYLAVLSGLALGSAERRRRWLRGLVAVTVVVVAAFTVADWTGRLVPQGWRVPAWADTLLWKEAPPLTASLCARGRAGGPATVLVLGLDERRPSSVGIGWLGVEAGAYYPAPGRPLAPLLDGRGGGPDLLCGPLPPDETPGSKRPRTAAAAPPTHILLTWARPSRRAEVERALAAAPACPWRVERELTHAVLLGRAAPPASSPAAAAAGPGRQPASQPGDGVR